MHILVVDDHPLSRTGIAMVVEQLEADVQHAGVGSCEEALHLIDGGAAFDLILLDLHLPGTDGMDGLAQLRDATPATPIVILSATEDSEKIRLAINAGAKGYIPKSSDSTIIISALRLVLSGGVFLPINLLQESARSAPGNAQKSDGNGLTARQLEVLQLLVRGESNKQIANALGTAENTVRVHVAAILKLLGVKNRTEASYAARSRGLL